MSVAEKVRIVASETYTKLHYYEDIIVIEFVEHDKSNAFVVNRAKFEKLVPKVTDESIKNIEYGEGTLYKYYLLTEGLDDYREGQWSQIKFSHSTEELLAYIESGERELLLSSPQFDGFCRDTTGKVLARKLQFSLYHCYREYKESPENIIADINSMNDYGGAYIDEGYPEYYDEWGTDPKDEQTTIRFYYLLTQDVMDKAVEKGISPFSLSSFTSPIYTKIDNKYSREQS